MRGQSVRWRRTSNGRSSARCSAACSGSYPRVQLVLTPPTSNLDIPNEDARSVDLEDSNLFALNRFPGYDRWEDSSRVTYGVDWSLDRPNLSIDSNIGQSYPIHGGTSIFSLKVRALTDRVSDIVGRTRIRYGRFIDITHRYRIDKSNFAVRRNEVDLTSARSRPTRRSAI